jgi:menaquinone-dependent protoporphyrinogen IX oxidase
MKSIVIYKGKYGATAQYAQWLGEALNLPIHSADNSDKVNLREYDLFIIGTSVYIGKLQITPWLKANLSSIRNKKIILFLVAGTPAHEKEKLERYVKSGIPEEIWQNCQQFYLPGKMIMKNLSWKDRFLLKMGARLVKDPRESKRMLTDYNSVKKENISGIIAAAKKYSGVEKAPVAL